MKVDIELKGEDKKLIIDTKYYVNALSKSNFGETKTLISNNLYQIFTYVKKIQTLKGGKLVVCFFIQQLTTN